jgi:general secretion pathway protein C
MKQIINSKHLSILIFILSIIVIVKLLWLITSMLFLPNIGERYQPSTQAKKLYYRVRLTNESKGIALTEVERARQAAAAAAANKINSMKGYKLLGLYNSEKALVVTVSKGKKTNVLAKGEKVNGFKLISAGRNFAIFQKNNEEFKLSLEDKTNSKAVASSRKSKNTTLKTNKKDNNSIVEKDGIKQIPKTLLTSYTKDMDKIWKDIGLAQYKKNGKAAGFKVNFVRKGSDMEKLGIKRGDVLTAVNAEPLNLSSAMGFFNDIKNLEDLTLTVDRNGKSKDLEYEIQ